MRSLLTLLDAHKRPPLSVNAAHLSASAVKAALHTIAQDAVPAWWAPTTRTAALSAVGAQARWSPRTRPHG